MINFLLLCLIKGKNLKFLKRLIIFKKIKMEMCWYSLRCIFIYCVINIRKFNEI